MNNIKGGGEWELNNLGDATLVCTISGAVNSVEVSESRGDLSIRDARGAHATNMLFQFRSTGFPDDTTYCLYYIVFKTNGSRKCLVKVRLAV